MAQMLVRDLVKALHQMPESARVIMGGFDELGDPTLVDAPMPLLLEFYMSKAGEDVGDQRMTEDMAQEQGYDPEYTVFFPNWEEIL